MEPRAHKVSVVVPACNVERYIEQCLGSIRSSLGRSLQVIVVDDGSTDSTRAIAERFIGSLPDSPETPDFTLLSKPNGGYGSAMNRGIEHADGTYLGIVEADDYLAGDLFGALYNIALATAMPDIVKSTYWRVWMPDAPEQRVWHSLLRHRGVPTWEEGTITLGAAPQLVRYHPSIWSAIYRRDFLETARIRFVEAPGGGWVDNPFSMRALCQASRIAYTDDAWYCYREDRPGSSSVLKAPEVPLLRWKEMAAEVEGSPYARDPGVLAVLYTIAFQHLGHLWDSPAYAEVEQLAAEILASMDPAIVLGIPELAPGVKARYLALTGHEGRSATWPAYLGSLARELIHSTRENGLEFTLWRLGLATPRATAPRPSDPSTKEAA